MSAAFHAEFKKKVEAFIQTESRIQVANVVHNAVDDTQEDTVAGEYEISFEEWSLVPVSRGAKANNDEKYGFGTDYHPFVFNRAPSSVPSFVGTEFALGYDATAMATVLDVRICGDALPAGMGDFPFNPMVGVALPVRLLLRPSRVPVVELQEDMILAKMGNLLYVERTAIVQRDCILDDEDYQRESLLSTFRIEWYIRPHVQRSMSFAAATSSSSSHRRSSSRRTKTSSASNSSNNTSTNASESDFDDTSSVTTSATEGDCDDLDDDLLGSSSRMSTSSSTVDGGGGGGGGLESTSPRHLHHNQRSPRAPTFATTSTTASNASGRTVSNGNALVPSPPRIGGGSTENNNTSGGNIARNRRLSSNTDINFDQVFLSSAARRRSLQIEQSRSEKEEEEANQRDEADTADDIAATISTGTDANATSTAKHSSAIIVSVSNSLCNVPDKFYRSHKYMDKPLESGTNRKYVIDVDRSVNTLHDVKLLVVAKEITFLLRYADRWYRADQRLALEEGGTRKVERLRLPTHWRQLIRKTEELAITADTTRCFASSKAATCGEYANEGEFEFPEEVRTGQTQSEEKCTFLDSEMWKDIVSFTILHRATCRSSTTGAVLDYPSEHYNISQHRAHLQGPSVMCSTMAEHRLFHSSSFVRWGKSTVLAPLAAHSNGEEEQEKEGMSRSQAAEDRQLAYWLLRSAFPSRKKFDGWKELHMWPSGFQRIIYYLRSLTYVHEGTGERAPLPREVALEIAEFL